MRMNARLHKALPLVIIAGLLAATALGLWTGCGGRSSGGEQGGRDPADLGSPGPDGLQIETADPEAGLLRGSYRERGLVVYFEARRGGILHDEQESSEPRFEVGARFFSTSGETFSAASAGHGFADPAWAPTEVLEDDEFNPEIRLDEFRLTRKVAEVMAGMHFPGLEPEQRALIDLGNTASEEFLIKIEEDQPIKGSTATSKDNVSDGGDVRTSSASRNPLAKSHRSYSHVLEIRKKGAFHPANPWADHSATWIRSRDSRGRVALQSIASNHGTPANDPLMENKCTRTFRDRPRSLPVPDGVCERRHEDRQCSPYCCASEFSLTPGPFHSCNDDSLLQRDIMVVNGAACLNTPYCNDFPLERWTPSCW